MSRVEGTKQHSSEAGSRHWRILRVGLTVGRDGKLHAVSSGGGHQEGGPATRRFDSTQATHPGYRLLVVGETAAVGDHDVSSLWGDSCFRPLWVEPGMPAQGPSMTCRLFSECYKEPT